VSDLECPYCEHYQDADPDCYEPDVYYDTECDECGKVFRYSIEYVAHYSATTADCKNGGEHQWSNGTTFGTEVTRWRQCSGCDKKEVLSIEE
jgi:hypothetical protein